MTELKTHINNKENLYEVTMVTDNKKNYELVQQLIRGMIDGMDCGITIATPLDPTIAYINAAADK